MWFILGRVFFCWSMSTSTLAFRACGGALISDRHKKVWLERRRVQRYDNKSDWKRDRWTEHRPIRVRRLSGFRTPGHRWAGKLNSPSQGYRVVSSMMVLSMVSVLGSSVPKTLTFLPAKFSTPI